MEDTFKNYPIIKLLILRYLEKKDISIFISVCKKIYGYVKPIYNLKYYMIDPNEKYYNGGRNNICPSCKKEIGLKPTNERNIITKKLEFKTSIKLCNDEKCLTIARQNNMRNIIKLMNSLLKEITKKDPDWNFYWKALDRFKKTIKDPQIRDISFIFNQLIKMTYYQKFEVKYSYIFKS